MPTTSHHRSASSPVSYGIGVVCQYVLILMFGVAMVGKIMDPVTSREFISAALGIGAVLARVVLLATIMLEGFLVVSLLFFGSKRWPYYTTAALLGAFCLLILYGLYIDLPALCGCFGSIIESTAVNKYGLLRNIALVMVAFLAPQLKEGQGF